MKEIMEFSLKLDIIFTSWFKSMFESTKTIINLLDANSNNDT